MNARLLQTSKPSSLEIQTDRNVDPLLRKQVVKLGGAQVIEKIGGRGGTRTRGPLLANWGELGSEKIQVVVWAALSSRFHQNGAPNCSKLVPNSEFRMKPEMAANPYDNATCESFLKALKREEIHASTYRDFEDLRERMEEFIEGYYNVCRLGARGGRRKYDKNTPR